jgi:hypothetical protein
MTRTHQSNFFPQGCESAELLLRDAASMTFTPPSSPPAVAVRTASKPAVEPSLSKLAVILSLTSALLATGCGNTSTPTAPSPSAVPAAPAVTETFAGTLPVSGARFYSFGISVYGTVNATLDSIGGNGIPPTVEVNLGIGTPSGTTCNATPSPVQVSGDAGVTTVVTATEQPGVYCVIISDAGTLVSPANFAITIAHP